MDRLLVASFVALWIAVVMNFILDFFNYKATMGMSYLFATQYRLTQKVLTQEVLGEYRRMGGNIKLKMENNRRKNRLKISRTSDKRRKTNPGAALDK